MEGSGFRARNLASTDGKIVHWADYYYGLTSRRTALAATLRTGPSNNGPGSIILPKSVKV